MKALPKSSDRISPGTGDRSLEYFQKKHYMNMITSVKGTISRQVNNESWRKLKTDLLKFKKEHPREKLRQIDYQNA